MHIVNFIVIYWILLSFVVEIYLVSNVKKPCFNYNRIKPFWNCRMVWYESNGARLNCKVSLNTNILYCFSFEIEFSDRNILVIMTFFIQGMAFTNTSPLLVPTRAKQVWPSVYTESKFWIKLRNVKNIKRESILDGNSYICFMFYS